MTRTDDVFVSLDQRLKFSADNGADLFISLHADSIEEKSAADSIRGATIYTLSSKASDEQARIMAEKENASDLIAGIASTDHGGNEVVKNILIDLLKRETSNFSADFSHVLAKKLGKTITMSRIPRKSAAFKVLKQTHAPVGPGRTRLHEQSDRRAGDDDRRLAIEGGGGDRFGGANLLQQANRRDVLEG